MPEIGFLGVSSTIEVLCVEQLSAQQGEDVMNLLDYIHLCELVKYYCHVIIVCTCVRYKEKRIDDR